MKQSAPSTPTITLPAGGSAAVPFTVAPAQRVLRGWDIVIYVVVIVFWIAANLTFWIWWLQPEHVVTWPRIIVVSLAIAYDFTFMPAAFFFFLGHMKQPVAVPPPAGLRVAMVTAIVPSAETLDVLERTVKAMTKVRYPHDSWVLDEGGDPQVRELCERYEVHYWSRKGIAAFNQPDWPYQAKTKSGNYNAWFSDIAYEHYDFIVQLDTDHAPVPEYLDEVLGHFNDPKIAYVALPSVYWNLKDWTARGSSEQSQVFQGPIQMGYYGWANAPMIIGSHAAYRVQHLREIGGFGPSRAEDHLDTLLFVRAGYRGVFVSKNLATGLGPHNLLDYLVQEHQWAFSIAQVLFQYGRKKGGLTFRQRAVFLFSELWYGWFSLTYLTLFLLPIVALLTNRPIVQVPFLEFFLMTTPMVITAIGALIWAYRRYWFKPGTHFFISWQGPLLVVARWPIVLIAIFNAVVSVLFRGGAFTYMVTPKGARAIRIRDMLWVILPFVLLASISLGVTFLYPQLVPLNGETLEAAGYIIFALASVAGFIVLIGLALRDYVHGNFKVGTRLRSIAAGSLPLIATIGALLAGLILSLSINVGYVTDAVTYWPGVMTDIEDEQPDESAGAVAPEDETQPAIEPTQTAIGLGATPPPASTVAPTTIPIPAPEVSSWLFDPARSGVTFGAYDPNGKLNSFSGLAHIFIAWAGDEQGGVPVDQIRQHYAAGRPVMLAIEPWPATGMSEETLLIDIAGGEYDAQIARMSRALASIEQPILVRFAHEMDMTGVYPWANDRPAELIAAYRHVVDLARQEGATNVLWVWSPGGMLDAIDYYPGDEYADYVATAILQFTGWETGAGYTTPRPISVLIQEKYQLLVDLNKPIIIAEAGIAVEPELKTARLAELIDVIDQFPLVRAVVYFNYQNPVMATIEDRPDWSLNEQDIELLRTAITSNPWFEQRPE